MKRSISMLALMTLGVSLSFITTPAQTPAPPKSDKTSSAGLQDGTTITVELSDTVDVKNAKYGDAVTARVVNDVWSADTKLMIPHGSQLTGYVAVAQPRTKEHAESRLGVVFDTATFQNNQTVSFRAVITALPRSTRWPGASDTGYPTETDNVKDRSAAGSTNPRIARGNTPGIPGNNPMWSDVSRNNPLTVDGDPIADLKIRPFGNVELVTSTKREVALKKGWRLTLQVVAPTH